jgi:acetolactate synthase-1/2/3 large subunit
MKVSDYVAEFLVQHGVCQVFAVTGGGAMHLNDSLGNHPGLNVVYNHHEQACAMAAEGYARMTNGPAVVSVTTGPGGINALNGVFGAWTDSIPMLIISGQVKRETCMATYPDLHVRQLGDQEADIIGMVKGITKYAVLVSEPDRIRYHLERALYLTTAGRPGPCWLDIPIDVQSALMPPEACGYTPELDHCCSSEIEITRLCNEIARKIADAKRPVIMVGKGVRQAGMEEVLRRITCRLKVPVVTAWTGIDMIGSEDPLFCGRPGDIGDRAGNFTVQNSDLLLILGTRLSLRQVSYNWKSFARKSFKIQIDIDKAEMGKMTARIDLPIHGDLRQFLPALEKVVEQQSLTVMNHATWLKWCRERVARYPVLQGRHQVIKGEELNPYHFMSELFERLLSRDNVVCANGTANVVGFQTAKIHSGQRMFCNSGDASMGFGLPAAIGVAVAYPKRRTICLEGDGSIMMNIQELQTVAFHGWPIKIFVLNNGGYVSIRQSQQNFFGRLTGESGGTGVSFPEFEKIGQAFGLPTCRISGKYFLKTLEMILADDDPILCNVVLDSTQGFEPKLAAKSMSDGRLVSPPLEDMFPFLSREELNDNMMGLSSE